MERQFRLEEVHIFANQRSIAYTSISIHNDPEPPQREPAHTSNTIATNTAHQAINPIDMLLSLPDNNRMALLQNLMDGDKRLVRLDLVGEHRLAIGIGTRGSVWKRARPEGRRIIGDDITYTFIPAQKAAEDLWSQV